MAERRSNISSSAAEAFDDKEVVEEEFEVELDDLSAWAMNFYECAAEGDLPTLKQILDSGKVDVDDVDVDGFTALMVASAEGHREVALELLRRGAQVSMRTHELRSTALHFAAKQGDHQIVAALCKADPRAADACNVNADTPLLWACIEGRTACVRELLAHGADVNVVNQCGATTLICAVMIGEDPEADDSDDARADMLELLLDANSKLINFQDREGSTAMHLAASCGYLNCVKTLLARGADITLRNAIGQTPLEEAEATGVTESHACVDHLRTVWRQLEEQAAARMMSMLELEDANESEVVSGPNSAGKKHKKKNKRAKRKTKASSGAMITQQQTSPALNTASAPQDPPLIEETKGDDEADESSGASDDELKTRASEADDVVNTAQADEEEAVSAEPSNAALSIPEGAWTTVSRKQKPVVSTSEREIVAMETVEPSAPVQLPETPRTRASKWTLTNIGLKIGSLMHVCDFVEVIPYHSRSKTSPPPPINELHTGITQPTSFGVGLGGAPLQTRLVGSRSGQGATLRTVNSRYETSTVNETFATAPAFSMASAASVPTSTASMDSRLLSHIQQDGFRLSTQASPWRSAFGNGSSSLNAPSPAFSSATSTSTTLGRSLWKYPPAQRAMVTANQSLIRENKEKWVSRLELADENVADAIALLACGICGELVNDNLQCNAAQVASTSPGAASTAVSCTQLYCATCVAKTAAATNSLTASGNVLKCVKCHHLMQTNRMTRNAFAQAQAASVGLSTSFSMYSANSGNAMNDSSRLPTTDEVKHVFDTSCPRASVLQLQPHQMVPGMDLSGMSMGQLDLLERAHHQALAQIMDLRLENARTLERLRIDEWLKTQRDILHFTMPSMQS